MFYIFTHVCQWDYLWLDIRLVDINLDITNLGKHPMEHPSHPLERQPRHPSLVTLVTVPRCNVIPTIQEWALVTCSYHIPWFPLVPSGSVGFPWVPLGSLSSQAIYTTQHDPATWWCWPRGFPPAAPSRHSSSPPKRSWRWYPPGRNAGDFLWIQELGCSTEIGDDEKNPHTRSGKHTKNDGQIHHFSWENSLFLWPCSIANC